MEGESKAQIKNIAIGVIISLLVAVLFYLASVQMGGYRAIDIYGGSAYSFILSMIISFSVIPNLMSRLSRKRDSERPKRAL